MTRGRVEGIHLVSDEEIVRAMRAFLDEEQLILEGSAAVGLAALLSGRLRLTDRKVVLVLTGRNIQGEQVLELLGKR